MTYQAITYAVADRIATLTLNRPDARNGYTVRMADELALALDQTAADPDVRVIVLAAAGTDFCVGMDLSGGGLDVDPDELASGDYLEPASRVTTKIFASHKPVIAAIQGAAVGVGATMILPCDYRLAADDARFGYVFAQRGIYPEGGSTWFLPRIVGLGRAMDWMISGRVFPASEALAAGLVHQVRPAAELLEAAYRLAGQLIAQSAPVSVAVIRQALFRMSGLDSPGPAFALDSKLIASCVHNPDAVEGIVSFLQHRPPEFTGAVPADLPDFLPWLAEPATSDPPATGDPSPAAGP